MTARTEAAEWLDSWQGRRWSRRVHDTSAMAYHDLIELRNDDSNHLDAAWLCDDTMMNLMRMNEGWEELPWRPECPPERA